MLKSTTEYGYPTLHDTVNKKAADFIWSAIITVIIMSMLLGGSVDEAHAYVAPKTTTVNFIMNGGDDDNVTVTVPVGMTFGQILYKMRDEESPKREGYIFTGWYFDENGEFVIPKTAPVKKDADAYAGWKQDLNHSVVLTIRFGGGHIKNTNVKEASVTVKSGSTLKSAIYELQAESDAKYGSHTVVRKGYKAKKGFYTAKKNGSKIFPDTSLSGDAVAYVQWKKKADSKSENEKKPKPIVTSAPAVSSTAPAIESTTSGSAVSTVSAIDRPLVTSDTVTPSATKPVVTDSAIAGEKKDTANKDNNKRVIHENAGIMDFTDIVVIVAAIGGVIVLFVLKVKNKNRISS